MSISQGPSKRPKTGPLSLNEKTLILNCYISLKNKDPSASVDDIVELTAAMLCVAKSTIYRLLKESKNGTLQPPKTPSGRKPIEIDESLKQRLRRKVHGFYLRKEIPTLDKIMTSVQEDTDYPKFSRMTLCKLLKDVGFRYTKHNRKSLLIDKPEIVFWRRDYLRSIRHAREQNLKIFYLDETWINAGYTVSKSWQDENIKSGRQAFVEGLSLGLQPPSGKGKRLIIVHVGSSEGFVDGGLLTFISKRTGDYHEDMNGDVFEEWFVQMLDLIPKGAVIVMDNASYHSRLREALPTSRWRKAELLEWLISKNIKFPKDPLRKELYRIAKMNKNKYKTYIVEEMASSRGISVLRLPPYHCELNPIELIWAQVKGEVGKKILLLK